MNSVLNNLQKLMCHKTQTTNNQPNKWGVEEEYPT